MSIEDLLELLGKDTLVTEGKFEDVLLAQLGKRAQIAIDLSAISATNPEQAKELAQELDRAQRRNEPEEFNRLVLQVEQLAAEARQ